MQSARRARVIAGPWVFLASFLCASMPLAAVAVDWNGASGVDSNWSTAGNWVGGVAPAIANTTVVTFGAAGTTFAPIADAPWTINRLDLTGATPYLLTGGLITFDGAAPQLNLSGGAHAIANDLSLASDLAFTNAIDLTITGQLSGLGGISKSGPGRLTMANFLMYSGQTTVNGGTLQIGNGVVGPTGFFVPVVDNATIEFAGSGAAIVLGAGLVGSGDVVVSGGVVQSPGLAMEHAGSTTISGGQLTATVLNNGPLTIAAPGLFESGDSTVGSLAGAGRLDSNGTAVTVGGDGTSTTFSGTLAGLGGLTKVGAGRFTMANFLMYSGQTTVNGGTLQIGNGVVGPTGFFVPVVDNA
ncbi:MAG TPA: autotransporter-associated beta strand repeat-containing protein, partial [Usitatibacteraceae bacterium]|nr:autotransporter-associated beta strand repeat-containing protein [Usitatibacteraceae bacterium]